MLKKKIFFFAAFVFLVFVLLSYQRIKGGGRFIDFSTYPLRILEQVTSSVIKSSKNLVNSYVLIVGKEEENNNLRGEISVLEQEINKLMEAGHENERLRKILQLKSERREFITSAEVYARDPTNWFQMLWINKGAKEGITEDMVAITPVGPVGRIHRVFDEGANVILITDVNSAIAVRLQSSRIEGILEGRGDNRCYLKYISTEVDVNVGDKLITSGFDGLYPEGLAIGYISRVEKEEGEIFQQVEVVPAQDLTSVEEVVILKR